MPPESSFQLNHKNTKYSVVLQDTQIPQEAKYGISSLLEGDYISIILKSPMDEGRTNLFQMDIQTMALPIACKLYPVLLKYQMFIGEEIRLFKNTGCISKSLSPWAAPVIIVPKESDPLNPQKQELCLVVT